MNYVAHIPLLAIALFAWVIIRRLLFNRLLGIPGPWTARIFGFYEFYHNIWRDGEWCKTFPELHKRYISSPLFKKHHEGSTERFTSIFRLGTDFYKDESFYTCADNHGSVFSLSDRDEHRERRKVLAPRFSKQAAELAAPRIQARLQDLVEFMVKQSRKGEGCNITDLFRAVAINWVADAFLGDCGDWVNYEARKLDMLEDIDGLSALIPTLRFFPYLATLNALLPSSVVNYLTPSAVAGFKKICKDHTRPLLNTPTKEMARRTEASVAELLIFHRLETTGKPPTLDYLAEEAFTFIDAGVDTTGGTLVTALYHVLKSPEILRKLRKELDEALGRQAKNTDIDPRKLGELPYLNAIIKESHRIWPAIPGPLPRVVPPAGINIGSYFIPGGTTVSATHHSLHYNETIFPEPHKFNPERWLKEEEREGGRYLNPYSRGTRACIGINLAQIQLRLTLSHLFAQYELELCDPVPSRHEWKDHFVAHPKEPIFVKFRERKGQVESVVQSGDEEGRGCKTKFVM
ncbi:cytochrome P450 [Aspergillus nidulans var. acristatus]